jgi:sugar lactone lactonase YvrE
MKTAILSLCLVAFVALATAAPLATRRAIFFEEQRAGKVEYMNWPPVPCKADGDCVGINASYCMNDKTKTAPYFCHQPIITLAQGLARPTGLCVDSNVQKVFYTEDDQTSGDTQWPLSVVNVDGSGKSSVVPKLLDPQGLGCDTKNQKVYYTEHHGQRVGSVNYDGTNQTVLHTFTGDINFPSAVVVDNKNGYIFVQVEGALSTGGQLWRMGLDGSNPTKILDGIVRAYGVAVDSSTQTVFYVQGGHGGFIGSVSYDGKTQKNVLEGLDYPFQVAVDEENQRIVFTTSGVGDGVVTTVKFDGSDVQHVANFGFAPMGVGFGFVPY